MNDLYLNHVIQEYFQNNQIIAEHKLKFIAFLKYSCANNVKFKNTNNYSTLMFFVLVYHSPYGMKT